MRDSPQKGAGMRDQDPPSRPCQTYNAFFTCDAPKTITHRSFYKNQKTVVICCLHFQQEGSFLEEGLE